MLPVSLLRHAKPSTLNSGLRVPRNFPSPLNPTTAVVRSLHTERSVLQYVSKQSEKTQNFVIGSSFFIVYGAVNFFCAYVLMKLDDHCETGNSLKVIKIIQGFEKLSNESRVITLSPKGSLFLHDDEQRLRAGKILISKGEKQLLEGQIDQAECCYIAAAVQFANAGDRGSLISTTLKLADLNLFKERYDAAQKIINALRGITTDDRHLIVIAKIELQINIKLHKLETAREVAKHGLQLADRPIDGGSERFFKNHLDRIESYFEKQDL